MRVSERSSSSSPSSAAAVRLGGQRRDCIISLRIGSFRQQHQQEKQRDQEEEQQKLSGPILGPCRPSHSHCPSSSSSWTKTIFTAALIVWLVLVSGEHNQVLSFTITTTFSPVNPNHPSSRLTNMIKTASSTLETSRYNRNGGLSLRNKRPRLSVSGGGDRATAVSLSASSSSSVPFHEYEKNNNNKSEFNHNNGSVVPAASSNGGDATEESMVGRLEELKQQEAHLAAQLESVRLEKLNALKQSRPLTIGIIGFGRFGQFVARAFAKHGHNIIVTSRSDYTDIANEMGVHYVPLGRPELFFFPKLQQRGAMNGDSDSETDGLLDIIVFCVSIVSFEDTIQSVLPYIQRDVDERRRRLQLKGGANGSGRDITTNQSIRGPLVVDVLSVKEHPRQVLLDTLPPEVDLLLTHPMFGPDSGKDGWQGLNSVYEKTRIGGVLCETPEEQDITMPTTTAVEARNGHGYHVEAVDRMERYLSIWEEEGCRMVQMSCHDHDAFAANSQFITHLMGRILGAQKGLQETPIDTSGFRNVLKLVDRTTADSFELFYGLFKFNQHSHATIVNLRAAMDDVVARLYTKEKDEAAAEVEEALTQAVATSTQNKVTTTGTQQAQRQEQHQMQP